MNLSQGQLFSSHLLLHLVDQGLSREEAYKKIQGASHGLQTGQHLRDLLLTHTETKSFFTADILEDIFSGKRHLAKVEQQMERVFDGR